MLLAIVAVAVVSPHLGFAQDADDGGGDDDGGPAPSTLKVNGAKGPSAADFSGHLQIVKGPPVAAGTIPPGGAIEIFPGARRTAMSVYTTDPVPIERARRGGSWLCKDKACSSAFETTGNSPRGNRMLKSIKVRTPGMPMPVTIWRRTEKKTQLDFDPGMLSQFSYNHVCAYAPLEKDDGSPPKPPGELTRCVHGTPVAPRPDQGEIQLGFEWPQAAEFAGFKYLAIVDSCNNALVYPFSRTFSVPAVDVATGACNGADGRVLRIFPSGSYLRVTAFNLDAAAVDDIVQVTYRVQVPALENYSSADPAKLLFPDFKLNELLVDCGPQLYKGPVDANGRPVNPGSASMPQDANQPKREPIVIEPQTDPGQAKPKPIPGEEPIIDPATNLPIPRPGAQNEPPAGPPPPFLLVGDPPSGPPRGPAPPGKPAPTTTLKAGVNVKAGVPVKQTPGNPTPPTEEGIGAKTLNHGTLVIAPEPLREGNCRIIWKSQLRSRLNVPLALHVELLRTDITEAGGEPPNLLPEDMTTWIVTKDDYTFYIPPLRANFDGNSRLKLIVRSDPLNANGKAVLVSDAGRVAAVLHDQAGGETAEFARRTIGSVTIHTVPLCGEKNFETLEESGSCVRAYLTIPAMLATIQITRAPWVEKPLITRSVLSAVGVALAFDSYDPVNRSAFPIAGQVGGFVQNLDDNRIGLMAYAGVAPTLPILGEGGNTTTFGFLAGIGMTYITNNNAPDEGFKPTAFLSVVVQVGQANPDISADVSGRYRGR